MAIVPFNWQRPPRDNNWTNWFIVGGRASGRTTAAMHYAKERLTDPECGPIVWFVKYYSQRDLVFSEMDKLDIHHNRIKVLTFRQIDMVRGMGLGATVIVDSICMGEMRSETYQAITDILADKFVYVIDSDEDNRFSVMGGDRSVGRILKGNADSDAGSGVSDGA